LFSLFYFGIGQCIASIAETMKIKRAYLFFQLNEKEIEVYQISSNKNSGDALMSKINS
jgi:hypothetical protein